MKPAIKIIYLALILLSIALVLWLANLNFPLSGQMELFLAPGRDTPIISQLGPTVRVRITDQGQEILESPVYFDLRAMPWFKEAVVYLTYQEAGAVLQDAALKSGPGWNYEVIKPETIENADDQTLLSIFSFDLSKGFSDKNVYRFLLSAKPQSENGKLIIKEIKILLQ